MGQTCRLFNWHVTSITAIGIESDPIKASTFVPMGKLADVQLATIIVTKLEDESKIEWEYDAIPDLAGFRLYQHSAEAPILLADETTITTDLREFTITTPEPQNGTIYYKLQAVSKFAGIRTKLTAPKKLE